MKRLRGIIQRVIRREGRVGRVRPTSRAVRLRPAEITVRRQCARTHGRGTGSIHTI